MAGGSLHIAPSLVVYGDHPDHATVRVVSPARVFACYLECGLNNAIAG